MTSQLLATMLNNNANAIAKDVPFTAYHLIGVYLGWIFLKTLSLDCNRKKMRDSLDNILPEIKKGFNIVYLGRYSDMPKKRLKKFLDYLDTCG